MCAYAPVMVCATVRDFVCSLALTVSCLDASQFVKVVRTQKESRLCRLIACACRRGSQMRTVLHWVYSSF